MDNRVLVETIRNLCKVNNISISQLEKDLNFGIGLISRWAKSDPSLSKIVDIADYFNLSLDEVIGRNQSTREKNESFINALYDKTIKDEIRWCDNSEFVEDILSSNDNYLRNYGGEYNELFTCDYEGSEFILYCNYHLEQGVIQILSIQFFIKPDGWEEPVIQQISLEKKQLLWEYLHSCFYGSSSEKIADDVKLSFLDDAYLEKQTTKKMTDYSDNIRRIEKFVKEIVDNEMKKYMLDK